MIPINKTRWQRFTDWLFERVAWRLPRRLAYWAFIRVWSAATVGEWTEEAVEMTCEEAVDRWNGG